MAERIRRADVAQFLRQFKGGEFDNVLGGLAAGNFQRLQKVYVRNGSNADLDIGDIVFIAGLPDTIGYEALVNEYLGSGFVLSGVAYDDNNKDRLSAIVLEPIKQDGIGEVYFPGLIAAKIYNYNSNYKYARIDNGKLKSAQGGKYKVIGASSPNNDSESFGYVILYTEGHYIGTTGSSITGTSQTTTVSVTNGPVIPDVTCPLLVGSNATIDSGKTVIVSFNLFTRKWEITETVC